MISVNLHGFFFLKNRSDVYQVFLDFQKLVERQFNRKIMTMQTDWGGEYQKLNSFFKQIGIIHHVSCPHAHQQNGSAERKHRHIVEVGLSLLAHASMPLKFWDEAFLTATYLINRTPSRVLNFDIPLTRLFQEQPNFSFLHVFGCACWPNLRPYNKYKLQFRSKKCVFLGYSTLHKGYKCLDTSSGRVYISRDVVFDESVFPFAELAPNSGKRIADEILLLPDHLTNHDRSMDFGVANVTNALLEPVQLLSDDAGSASPISTRRIAVFPFLEADGVSSNQHGVSNTVVTPVEESPVANPDAALPALSKPVVEADSAEPLLTCYPRQHQLRLLLLLLHRWMQPRPGRMDLVCPLDLLHRVPLHLWFELVGFRLRRLDLPGPFRDQFVL